MNPESGYESIATSGYDPESESISTSEYELESEVISTSEQEPESESISVSEYEHESELTTELKCKLTRQARREDRLKKAFDRMLEPEELSTNTESEPEPKPGPDKSVREKNLADLREKTLRRIKSKSIPTSEPESEPESTHINYRSTLLVLSNYDKNMIRRINDKLDKKKSKEPESKEHDTPIINLSLKAINLKYFEEAISDEHGVSSWYMNKYKTCFMVVDYLIQESKSFMSNKPGYLDCCVYQNMVWRFEYDRMMHPKKKKSSISPEKEDKPGLDYFIIYSIICKLFIRKNIDDLADVHFVWILFELVKYTQIYIEANKKIFMNTVDTIYKTLEISLRATIESRAIKTKREVPYLLALIDLYYYAILRKYLTEFKNKCMPHLHTMLHFTFTEKKIIRRIKWKLKKYVDEKYHDINIIALSLFANFTRNTV